MQDCRQVNYRVQVKAAQDLVVAGHPVQCVKGGGGLTENIFSCCGKDIEQDKRNGKISSRPLSRCRGFWWNKKTDRFKISVTLDDDGIFCVFVALAKKDHFQLINISGNGFSALWSSVLSTTFIPSFAIHLSRVLFSFIHSFFFFFSSSFFIITIYFDMVDLSYNREELDIEFWPWWRQWWALVVWRYDGDVVACI